MCPDFHDKYLKDILIVHDGAMKLREASEAKLYNSRAYNEKLMHLNQKGIQLLQFLFMIHSFCQQRIIFILLIVHLTMLRKLLTAIFKWKKKEYLHLNLVKLFWERHLN
jgi:hypothetical protein